jgi:hypothetical protein
MRHDIVDRIVERAARILIDLLLTDRFGKPDRLLPAQQGKRPVDGSGGT